MEVDPSAEAYDGEKRKLVSACPPRQPGIRAEKLLPNLGRRPGTSLGACSVDGLDDRNPMVPYAFHTCAWTLTTLPAHSSYKDTERLLEGAPDPALVHVHPNLIPIVWGDNKT